MKQFLILASCSIFFSGCCGIFCKPEIRYETKYVYQEVPELPLDPSFEEYQFEKISFNNKEFYIISPESAAILGANSISSKTYSNTLKTILKSLKSRETNSSVPR
jgi:hypothetical protein